jgi:hypothetical protein
MQWQDCNFIEVPKLKESKEWSGVKGSTGNGSTTIAMKMGGI